jgi:transcriptional regulator with XRE-family HTH domain
VSNDRLRTTLRSSGYSATGLAEHLDVDPKTVQRWVTRGRTPHRTTATRAAKLLNVPPAWLWPDLEEAESGAGNGEVIGFYSHRAQVPKSLWLEMLVGSRHSIDLVTYAALHLVEDHPETVEILKHKAANGVRVRIALGDPDTPEIQLRGREEGMLDGIVGRVRMANAYYASLGNAPGVELNLHTTTLYNSLYRYDDQMLVNHHVYGTHGYMAPVLHLRRSEHADLFDMYSRSFDLIWAESYPTEGSAPRPNGAEFLNGA